MPGARLKPLTAPLQPSREAMGTVIGGAIALLIVLAVFPLLRGPDFVPHMTLVNPTAYEVNVEVSASPADGWLDLGSVPRERQVALEGLVDEGGKWTFRFSSGGVFAGEMVLNRTALTHDHWRVNIPDGIAVPLQEAGLPTSAS